MLNLSVVKASNNGGSESVVAATARARAAFLVMDSTFRITSNTQDLNNDASFSDAYDIAYSAAMTNKGVTYKVLGFDGETYSTQDECFCPVDENMPAFLKEKIEGEDDGTPATETNWGGLFAEALKTP